MHITAKSRYALKFMMDLADHSEALRPRQRHDIASDHGIPVDFMDHITARLKLAELIESTRGRNGGFALKRPSAEIHLWDIFSAVEDHFVPVKCLESDGSCALEQVCISHDVWVDVFHLLKKELSEKKLSDLVGQWNEKKLKPRGIGLDASDLSRV